MADSLQRHEFGSGDLGGQRFRMAVREQWVLGAVEHQSGDRQLAEPGPQGLSALEDRVVRHGRLDVGRAVDDPAGERTHLLLVERDRSGVPVQVLHDVVDDGLPVGPVRLGGRLREPSSELIGHRREVGPAPDSSRSA